MRHFGDGIRSPLPIPGDITYRDKYDPIQDGPHREEMGLPPRDEKPPYLTDAEWAEIKIEPGEMNEPIPEWDGECQGSCCRESSDDSN